MKAVLTYLIVLMAGLGATVAPALLGAESAGVLPFAYQGLVDPATINLVEQSCREALADTSHSAEVHAAAANGLGICALLRNDFAAAEEHFTHAIELDPQRPAYLSNRGMALRRLNQWELAAEDYLAALALAPNHAHARNNLGWLRVIEAQAALNEPELLAEAVEHLQAAELTLARSNLAAAEMLRDDLAAAEAALPGRDDSLSIVTRQLVLLNAGELARCGGDWVAARDYYRRAYELGRDRHLPPPDGQLHRETAARENPWILFRLGAAELITQDSANAQRRLARAAEIFDGQTPGRYARMMAHLAACQLAPDTVFTATTPTATVWVDALELYLADELSRRRLARMAEDNDPAARAAKQCEMYFMLAQKALIANDVPQARTDLQACLDAGAPATKLEATIAAAQLAMLQ